MDIADRQAIMATATPAMGSVTYYRTWDIINRRYLVKKRMDDEWELSSTPDTCCTNGRRFSHLTRTYSEPPSKKCYPWRTWDPIEGRWILETTIPSDMLRKQPAQYNIDNATDRGDEEANEDVNTSFGVDIIAVRKRYF